MKRNKIFGVKLLFIFCLLSMAILTSGCIKYRYSIVIDNNNNVGVSEITTIDSSIVDNADPVIKQALNKGLNQKISNMSDEKYSVVKVKEGVYIGLKSYKKHKMSKFLDTDLPEGFTSTQVHPIVVKKSFYKTKYSMSLKYDVKYATKTILINSGISLNDIKDRIEPSYPKKPLAELVIKIPTRAISHNANQVISDKEYKWSLMSKTPLNIEITYEKLNWFNIVLTVLVIIVVALLIVAINNKEFSKKSPLDWF